MDTILTDLHLDTRIKVFIAMNAIVTKLEHAGEVWEGNAQYVNRWKQYISIYIMTAVENIVLIQAGSRLSHQFSSKSSAHAMCWS